MFPSMPVAVPEWNGLELHMLALGNADSIVLINWSKGLPQNVLIDGGDKGSFANVRAFLASRSITYLNHVICTHPHADHAGGLVQLISDRSIGIGQFWMHDPCKHGDITEFNLMVAKIYSPARVAKIEESLSIRHELFSACAARGLTPMGPFAGQEIAFLRVCGPSEQYYNELVPQFCDTKTLETIEAIKNQDALADVLIGLLQERAEGDTLDDNPQTTPENSSSVILATQVGLDTFLFTADAGAAALSHAANIYPMLKGCTWMQIPHHGSRRNITNGLIEYFRPKVAFVSAAGTDAKHPRRAVVNAFNGVGSKVFSTHYPKTANLRYRVGNVPPAPDYHPATPLYAAAKAATS